MGAVVGSCHMGALREVLWSGSLWVMQQQMQGVYAVVHNAMCVLGLVIWHIMIVLAGSKLIILSLVQLR